MNKLGRIMVGGVASVVGCAQAALAGVGSYSSSPTVSDNNSDAGIFLLLAVGALIVIKSVATPKPSQDAETAADPEKTE